MAALVSLKTIRKDNNIRIKHKMTHIRALVIPTFLYASETWTLTTRTTHAEENPIARV